MMVFGIDADTKRLAVSRFLGDGSLAEVKTIQREVKGAIVSDYDVQLADVTWECADAHGVIYLEGTFLSHFRGASNVAGFARLCEVRGEIRAAARGDGVRVEIVTPQEWRRDILGFTKDKKLLAAAAKEKAEALAGRNLTEHEADAVCIGLYGVWHETESAEKAG